nr:hypothetical protein HK105_003444 [Polyrhizophydium stewartii]
MALSFRGRRGRSAADVLAALYDTDLLDDDNDLDLDHGDDCDDGLRGMDFCSDCALDQDMPESVLARSDAMEISGAVRRHSSASFALSRNAGWPSASYKDSADARAAAEAAELAHAAARAALSAKTSRFVPELLAIVLKHVRAVSGSPAEAQRTLHSVCLVNRHWHSCAVGALWEQPFLASDTSIAKLAAACIPPSVCPPLSTSLRLQLALSPLEMQPARPSHADRDAASPKAASLGRLVRRLDLSRVRLHEPSDSSVLATLATYCTRIRMLRIWCESLDIFMLQRLATCSRHLDTLVIAGHLGPWIEVGDTSLAGLVGVVSRLRVVQIDVGFDGDSGRNRLARLVAASVGPSVRHLRLAGADDDERVMSLCDRCPNLEVLLYGWANLTPRAVHHIAARTPNLRVLDLRGCQKAVTPAAMHDLALKCTRLESVDLSFTSGGDGVIASLAEHAANLHTAILAGYTCSEQMLIRFVARVGARLRVLSIAWFGGVLTDAGVLAIAKHCPNIEKLDVRGCRQVSEAALRTLIAAASRLVVLKLEGPGGWEAATPAAAPPAPPTAVQRRHRRASAPATAAQHADVSRRLFLLDLKRRFPSDELVRLEEANL